MKRTIDTLLPADRPELEQLGCRSSLAGFLRRSSERLVLVDCRSYRGSAWSGEPRRAEEGSGGDGIRTSPA
jgi:hypothetical protein